MPNSSDTVSLGLRWAIPTGFFGRLFLHSSILKDHLVTVDAGVIDADFRGIVQALLVNHNCNKTYTVRTGDRIAQVVFLEKFGTKFQRVTEKGLLGATKQGNGSFGSTGLSLIKKIKVDEEDENEEEVNHHKCDDKCILLQIVEKPKEDLQIVSEEAVMKVEDKVVIRESITTE